MQRCSLAPLLFAIWLGPAWAQGTREDYVRAERFLPGNVRRLVFEGEVAPRWIGTSARFWYRNEKPDRTEFVLVDAARGERRPAFDHEKLAAGLARASGRTCRAEALPFDEIRFAEGDRAVEFAVDNVRWRCDLSAYECSRIQEPPARWPGGAPSPDGRLVAFVRNYNLHAGVVATGQEIPLTRDGERLCAYATPLASPAEMIRQGRMDVSLPAAVSWSPDSTRLATFRLDQRTAPQLTMVQFVPPAGMLPVRYSYAYPLPIDAVLPAAAPLIFEVSSQKQVAVEARPIELLYYGAPRFSWFKDSRRIHYTETERGYRRVRLLEADALTGKTRVLLEEQSDTHVDPHLRWTRLIEEGVEILASSERDGWNHLYLYDGATGKLKNRVTSGPWVVRAIESIDAKRRVIYFTAGGREPGRDPYLRHLYRINFDGSDLRLLTRENAEHAVSFSRDCEYFVDAYSRVEQPAVSALRRAGDGTVLLELERADISRLLAAGWKQPERFRARARDGKTDIYGVMWRPSNFDPSRKYPVIEQIYTGPHGFFAPVTFAAYRSLCQSIAELGFVCVMVDGMGTNMRSRAFHEVSYKNLGDGGIDDHIAALRQLAERYPCLDLDRAGIFGHSAGGYDSAHAMLTHPEFYKAGVSSAGNHDHRLDKAWWIELWMGHPAGKHYEEQSNVTLAKNLKGKLLLAHGDVDENVPTVETMRLVDALIKANKDFDLLILPNRNHGFGNDPYFVRRRWDFLVRHLLGATPPENYQIKAQSSRAN